MDSIPLVSVAVAISFVCSLIYWVWSFAQKEAEHQEFTPQMRHPLLTLAEAVHGTRTAMTEKAGLGVSSSAYSIPKSFTFSMPFYFARGALERKTTYQTLARLARLWR